MIDLVCALGLLGAAATAAIGYALWRRGHGAARYARVDRDGGSAWLGLDAMSGGYWALQPFGRALVRAGVSANEVTYASLGLGLAGGVAFAAGHFGVAAVIAAVAALCDALDGLVARATGTASRAGALLDATVDRYQEFAFFAGVAVAWRAHVPGLALALGAALGAFMVSYASAKAEAHEGRVPRGAMRRPERAVYVIAGAALTPLVAFASRRLGLPPVVAMAPMAAALALIAVVGNVSAVRRLALLGALDMDDVPPPARANTDGLGRTLGRHQVGSAAATAVDFSVMIALVSGFGVGPVAGAVAGASAGAVTNFLLGRHWIFHASEEPAAAQAARYALVSAASLALNAAGEYVFAVQAGAHYVVARVATSLIVSLAWNFPMQRRFVFHVREETAP